MTKFRREIYMYAGEGVGTTLSVPCQIWQRVLVGLVLSTGQKLNLLAGLKKWDKGYM